MPTRAACSPARVASTAVWTNWWSGCWRSEGSALTNVSFWTSPACAPTSRLPRWWRPSAAIATCDCAEPNREHDLIWRQGLRSLVSGSLLFIVGILLSFAFTRPGVGEFANDLIGSGVFLVVAWVGLWYPLDLLFIAREQAKREISVLGKMLTLPVIVRARDHALPAAPVPAAPVSRGLPLSLEARFRRFRGPSKSGI
jgi:hypothetical protein